MNKKIGAFLAGTMLTLSAHAATSDKLSSACPSATPVNAPGFCGSFKVAAECHCAASGLPRGMCANHRLLYERMINTFGSLQRACEFQHDTNTQECIDDWNCYLSGGVTSKSEPCNGNGEPCI